MKIIFLLLIPLISSFANDHMEVSMPECSSNSSIIAISECQGKCSFRSSMGSESYYSCFSECRANYMRDCDQKIQKKKQAVLDEKNRQLEEKRIAEKNRLEYEPILREKEKIMRPQIDEWFKLRQTQAKINERIQALRYATLICLPVGEMVDDDLNSCYLSKRACKQTRIYTIQEKPVVFQFNTQGNTGFFSGLNIINVQIIPFNQCYSNIEENELFNILAYKKSTMDKRSQVQEEWSKYMLKQDNTNELNLKEEGIKRLKKEIDDL